MLVYHRTTAAAADAIERDGFRDSTGTYLTATEWTGVWVSYPIQSTSDLYRLPLDAPGFAITVDENRIAEYEWVQDGEAAREWLVPAALLNECPRRLLSDDELDAAEDEAWRFRYEA